ncbi:UNKNOWN [Stylonychia lemnae]|uniref:Major facilitator superfamily protein n=1 Tax=Stylonychia lemnae TaxID=5949 RepID=A0A078B3B5_STYLE|nr:UNKNOWN [Stylonychia lemnae]|eukprot:CDW89020.1 UNKNOWN [Stylonychia lemnae]
MNESDSSHSDKQGLLSSTSSEKKKSMGAKILALGDGEDEDEIASEIDKELNAEAFRMGVNGRRLLYLGMLCSVLFMNQIGFSMLNIADSSQLQYMPGIFFLAFFTTTTEWIEKHGLWRTTLLSIAIQMFAILFAMKGGSYGRTAGSIMNGIAMCFLYNQITTFSCTWFGIRGRIVATGIQLFFANLGYWSAVWADYDNKYKISNDFFNDSFLGIGVANLFLLFIIAFFYEAKPEDCPSKSQAIYKRVDYDLQRDFEVLKDERIFKRGFSMLCVLLIITYFSPYCVRWHYSKLVHSDHRDGEVIHFVIVPLMQLSGLVVSTILLARYFRFKVQLTIVIWANVIAIILCEAGLLDGTHVLFYIGYILESFFIGCLQIIIYELVVELSFPVSPALALSSLHLVAFPSILVLNAISDDINMRNQTSSVINDCLQFIQAGILAFIAIGIWQLSYRLKRIEFDLGEGTARQ